MRRYTFTVIGGLADDGHFVCRITSIEEVVPTNEPLIEMGAKPLSPSTEQVFLALAATLADTDFSMY